MPYLIKRNAIIVRVLFSPGKPDIKGNPLESHSIMSLIKMKAISSTQKGRTSSTCTSSRQQAEDLSYVKLTLLKV
jgi:hypothetical protein